MNKNLLSIILFPVFVNGKVTDPFESERDVEIITDDSTYLLNEEIKIKAEIRNNLSKSIRIVNSGDAIPFFVLEKKVENFWVQVYSPVSIDLDSESTLLESGESFTSEINLSTPNIQANPVGEYRLNFYLIEKESNNQLPEKYLYSNVFVIKEEI